jgi:DNA-binding LytR/AlgR family response regulator
MKGIIIEDDMIIRFQLEEYCKQMNQIEIIAIFDNAKEGFKFLSTNQVDFILLDLYMPNMSGIDFLKTLNKNIPIVIITSCPNFAVDSYLYENVVDYILKPINYERLAIAIEKIENKINSLSKFKKTYLLIAQNGKFVKITFDDILFIQANMDYVCIQTSEKRYYLLSTLKSIQSQLLHGTFTQVHRSFLVNYSKVNIINQNHLVVNEIEIPISKPFRNQLIELLDNK